MATVFPFKAYRPKQGLEQEVASVPYDVVNRTEAGALADGKAHSFLHVTKPEIDLPESVDDHDVQVYKQGGEALRRFIAEGTLVQDAKDCFYLYALTMDGKTQVGFVLCASVEEYDRNYVRKHEYTRPDKEQDRVDHMVELAAQTGTVFLVHRDESDLTMITNDVCSNDAPIDFTAPDGIRHQLWVIDDDSVIERVKKGFEATGPIYIADGHHRSASASRIGAAARDAGDDNPNRQRFLAVSFPISHVRILPYNRVVRDLRGMDAETFLAKVRETFEVTSGKPEPMAAKTYGMFLEGTWYGLRPKSYDREHPVKGLDVAVLQDQLLQPLLGIEDPRRDTRIEFVGGIRGDAELEKRVQQQGFAVAFSLYETSMEELLKVADAEEVMPPKSTWFEPKLRDGLVVHVF